MGTVAIDEYQVRALTGLDRANFTLEPERPRTVARRHPEHLPRRQGARMTTDRLERRGKPHLPEHVQVVIARGPVRAERHADPLREQLGYRRDARSELQVGPGAVHHFHVGARHELLFTGIDPDTVRGAQTRRHETDVCEVLDVRLAGYAPDDLDLLALFRRV